MAVILAGGESKRFGRPKGLVEIDGRPIVSILAAQARLAGIDEIYISANRPGAFASLGLPVIEDIRPGCGPLSGIHSAFVATGAGEILILPCDTPGISGNELRAILESAELNPDADVIFAQSPSGSHPLCALIRRAMVPAVESALKDCRLSVNELFERSVHVRVQFDDETPFANLNSPDDLEKWQVLYNGS